MARLSCPSPGRVIGWLLERTRYLLPLYEPLFNQPLRAYDVARTMGTAADRWLDPAAVNAAEIHRLTYYLGIDRKVGNFREYSANLHATPAISDSLREAVRDVYQYAREQTVFASFGGSLPGADVFSGDDILLSVDPGGDDRHLDNASGDDRHLDNAGGTTAIEVPVAVAVDVDGNDVYDCSGLADAACQGAGILGIGVLMDSAGDDNSLASDHAQGAGLLGQGVLLDAAGTDRYLADVLDRDPALFVAPTPVAAGGTVR